MWVHELRSVAAQNFNNLTLLVFLKGKRKSRKFLDEVKYSTAKM